MQDKYVGDVGDFGKLALLRSIGRGERLGVCWYFTTGIGESNFDGKHTGYLDMPRKFRHLDPELFDSLAALRNRTTSDPRLRQVSTLEELGVLPQETLYHRIPCPPKSGGRTAWTGAMVTAMRGATLTFVDPDNGIGLSRRSPKHVALEELQALSAQGAVLAYHHQTRMKGGAQAEYSLIKRSLLSSGFSQVAAVRLSPYSSRFYFLLNGTGEQTSGLRAFSSRWSPAAELFD